jgi:hypothetical protein
MLIFVRSSNKIHNDFFIAGMQKEWRIQRL